MKKEICAYVAGFMDAEAGFQIARRKDRHTILGYYLSVGIRISSTNKDILEYLSLLFGGNVSEHKLCKNIGKWKKAYRWQITSRRCMNILKLIYPYLKIKKPQADLMFEFDKTLQTNNKRVPELVMQNRWELKKRMNILNQRGIIQ